VCRQVRQETHDVKSFIFSARTPKRFRFTPGQFLTFDFPIDGEIVNRCYTISSAPTRPHLLSITVKKVPNGPVSNWLHANMKPGMEVAVSGPMGEFCDALHPAKKKLFLSGGSGITPLMSMSRTAHDLSDQSDIVFVHSARSAVDIIFRDELALIERNQPNFRAVSICETGRWDGFRGRLSLAALELIAPDFREREIFCCGPTPYMAAVRALLDAAGFDRAHYHEESFVFEELAAAAPEAAPTEASAEGKSYKVTLSKSNKSFDCPADTHVLDAARKAGLRLASSCTQGMCGTCKSKMTTGSVEMNHKGGIRQREIDQGFVLICCAKPTSDLVIER
jgi:ferredoxin-NADP reductase